MDWWQEVDKYWQDLIRLIERFHPASFSVGRADDWGFAEVDTYPITAPMAEETCESVRKEIKQEVKNPCSLAVKAKEERDGESLWRIFNQTWFGMPESTEVRYEPGFGILCDLCSEYQGE